ncbi:MAG: thioredoxin family protein [Candidatus Nanoarchaeia archaeon]|nr:thioredoxin family protein [Candidatus Jingweiarchaeum tengchongense]
MIKFKIDRNKLYGVFFGTIFLVIFFVYIYPTITGTAILITEKNSCNLDADEFDFIFAFSPLCPHCRNMAPLVIETEKAGYKVYWLDLTDSTCVEIAQKYKNGNAFLYVPTFLCLKNESDYSIGEVSASDLMNWVKNCVGNAR